MSIAGNEYTGETQNRVFDYTCFGLIIIDFCLLIVYEPCVFWEQMGWYHWVVDKKEEKLGFWQDLFDNLFAEVLLYPATICTCIGVSTNRVWNNDLSSNEDVSHEDRFVSIRF